MEKVMEGPMLEPDKSSLIAALNLRLGTCESFPTSKAQLQNAECIRNYFLENEWRTVFGTFADVNEKTRFIVKRVIDLGFRNPSEKSMASMAAIVFFGSDVPSPTVALSTVRAMKTLLRSCTSKMQTARSMDELPASSSDFKAQCPLFYQNAFGAIGDPVAAPGEDIVWHSLAAVIPLRSTRVGCGALPPALLPKAHSAFQTLCRVASVHRAPSYNDIPMTYFARQHNESASSMPMLAAAQGVLHEVSQPVQRLQLTDAPNAFPVPPTAICQVPTSTAASQTQPTATICPAPTPAVAVSCTDLVAVMRQQLSKSKPSDCDDEAIDGSPRGESSGGSEAAMNVSSVSKKLFKRPAAAAKGPAAAAAKGPAKVFKRPAAAANGRPFVLGCSKCRFKKKGCGQCRNPKFSGKRGHL